jgi:hypothetical protein
MESNQFIPCNEFCLRRIRIYNCEILADNYIVTNVLQFNHFNALSIPNNRHSQKTRQRRTEQIAVLPSPIN